MAREEGETDRPTADEVAVGAAVRRKEGPVGKTMEGIGTGRGQIVREEIVTVGGTIGGTEVRLADATTAQNVMRVLGVAPPPLTMTGDDPPAAATQTMVTKNVQAFLVFDVEFGTVRVDVLFSSAVRFLSFKRQRGKLERCRTIYFGDLRMLVDSQILVFFSGSFAQSLNGPR